MDPMGSTVHESDNSSKFAVCLEDYSSADVSVT